MTSPSSSEKRDPWWPLEFESRGPNASDAAYVILPNGDRYRINRGMRTTSKTPAYRIYHKPEDARTSTKRAGCDSLLEVRMLLLALAYPEGNHGEA